MMAAKPAPIQVPCVIGPFELVAANTAPTQMSGVITPCEMLT